MSYKTRTFESLEARQLLAGDTGFDSSAGSNFGEYAAAVSAGNTYSEINRIRVTSELSSAFAWSNAQSLEKSGVLIAVGRTTLSSLNPNRADDPVVDKLTFDKEVSRVLNLDNNRVLVATSEVADETGLRINTSVFMVVISSEGNLTVVDQIDRRAPLTSLTVKNGMIELVWEQQGQFANQSEGFATPELSIESQAQKWLKYRAEYLDSSSVQFADSFAIEISGAVSGQYIGGGRFVSERGGGVHIFSQDERIDRVVELDNYGTVLSVLSATFNELSREYEVLASVADAERQLRHLTMRIDVSGNLTAAELSESTMTHSDVVLGTDILRQTHHSLKSLYNNGVVDTTTVYPIPQESDLAIVTEQADGMDVQRISLPYHRVGFRPAFVIDDDLIVAIRADISALERSGFTAADDTIRYVAYLLRRDANGEFQQISEREVAGVDFDAAASVSPNAVTFRSQRSLQATGGFTTIRVNGDQMIIDEYTSDDAILTGMSIGLLSVSKNDTVAFTPWSRGDDAKDVMTQRSRLDVNGDGVVSALDALVIINRLNQQGAELFDGSGEPIDGGIDVNGDGRITAIDALMVINHLNGVNAFDAITPFEDENEDDSKDGINDRVSVVDGQLF